MAEVFDSCYAVNLGRDLCTVRIVLSGIQQAQWMESISGISTDT